MLVDPHLELSRKSRLVYGLQILAQTNLELVDSFLVLKGSVKPLPKALDRIVCNPRDVFALNLPERPESILLGCGIVWL